MAECYDFDLMKQLMAQDPAEQWVRHSDYAAIQAENERLRKALADLCDWIEHEVGAELPFDARRALEGGES